jgi:DMSO/TMAO reductase YedYZ molybdopterin-dependent catalytic subunit
MSEIKAKLIATKQAWAKAGRLLTGKTADPSVRLPPGQRLVRDWPVLDLGIQPDITPQKFFLDIDGAVENPVHLKLEEVMALKQEDSVSDMHCVTAWSRYDNNWQGISARTVLDLVRPLPSARHVVFHAHDGYTTNVLLEQFNDDDVYLVHSWEGQPIERIHGGPLRVLIPKLYLWKSAKWVNRIEFTTADRPGFWERNGYNNNADPWLEERYDDQ